MARTPPYANMVSTSPENLYEKNKPQTGRAKFTEAKKLYERTVNYARKTFNIKINSELRTLKVIL